MDELMLKPVCYSLGFCLVILKEVVNHQLQLDKMIGGCKVAEGTNWMYLTSTEFFIS